MSRARRAGRSISLGVLLLALVSPVAAFDGPSGQLARPVAASSDVDGLTRIAGCTELARQMRAAGAVPAALVPGAAAVGSAATDRVRVQEPGSDEPDVVKTDGRLLVSVVDGRVRVFDVAGRAPLARSTLALPGLNPTGLVLAGTRALVLGGGAAGGADGTLDLALVDLADAGRPRVLARELIAARHVVTRLADGVATVVVANEAAMPTVRAVDSTGRPGASRALVACSDVWRPAGSAGAGMLSALRVDVAGGRDLTAPSAAVLAAGSLAYVSRTRLYLATSLDLAAARPRTAVHAFDLDGPAAPSYAGSAGLDGTVAGRRAMSEYAGNLRALVSRRDGADIVVLRPAGRGLAEAGRARDVGGGAAARGVAWYGEVGAVATADRAHPVRLLDLGDPEHPAPAGSLRTPPDPAGLAGLDDFRLLGLGQSRGRLLLSAYDILDPGAPRATGAAAFGAPSSSLAELDGRRLVFDAGARTAVLPVTWRLGPAAACALGTCPADIDRDRFNGLVALRLGPDGTLARAGQWRSRGGVAGSWPSGDPPVTPVLLPDGRLVALDGRGLTLLATGNLTVRGFVPYPPGS